MPAVIRLSLVFVFSCLVFSALGAKLVVREESVDPLDLLQDEQKPSTPRSRPPDAATYASAKKNRDPTAPMTQWLSWAVDHSDKNSLHERAERIRQGLDEPMPIDRDVLEALFPNPLEAMGKLVNVIKNTTAAPEDVASKLMSLEDFIQDIDNANDLHKIGGIAAVSARLHEDEDPTVQKNAAWVIGTLVQSNPKTQQLALEEECLPKLLAIIRSPTCPVKTKAKALYAASAMIRSYPEALHALVEGDGLSAIVAMLRAPDAEVLHRKGATFVTDILTDDPSLAEQLGDLGACQAMVQVLNSNDVATQEKVLEALESLATFQENRRILERANIAQALSELRSRTDKAADGEPELFEHIYQRIDALSTLTM